MWSICDEYERRWPSASSEKFVPVVGAIVVLSPQGRQCNCHPNSRITTGINFMEKVLVDEQALTRALAERRIMGAALVVNDVEPRLTLK